MNILSIPHFIKNEEDIYEDTHFMFLWYWLRIILISPILLVMWILGFRICEICGYYISPFKYRKVQHNFWHDCIKNFQHLDGECPVGYNSKKEIDEYYSKLKI